MKSDQKQFKTCRVKRKRISMMDTFRVKLGLTAGVKGEPHRLPCSLPLTHWLMRSATPTFKPSASCCFSNEKIWNDNLKINKNIPERYQGSNLRWGDRGDVLVPGFSALKQALFGRDGFGGCCQVRQWRSARSIFLWGDLRETSNVQKTTATKD